MQTRRTSLLALVLGIILALAACSGSSTVASSATPTLSATPVVNAVYTSSDGAYSVKYPATWKTEALNVPSTSGAASITDDKNVDLFLIEPFTLHSNSSAQTILLAAISNDSFKDSKVDNSTTTQTYPSGTWTVATASTMGLSTSGNSTALSGRLYMTEHGGHTVIIITFAPVDKAASDQSMYFDAMLMSFTFLN